ncbi:MAG: hypothetical protein IRY91_11390 [Gemmatimonadaceae bacterium]|nr:hypothetical protein [Gemmatimonadaceae bacterium]
MSPLALYLVGYLIVVLGLAAAAYLLNVPLTWIVIGVVVLIGLGIMTIAKRQRERGPR